MPFKNEDNLSIGVFSELDRNLNLLDKIHGVSINIRTKD